MQLTLERGPFLRALAVTQRIVERRNTIPVLSNLRLGTIADRLSVRGTDLDIEAASSCPANIVAPGATTVPAGLLFDIVRKLPGEGLITLSHDDAKGQMAISAGRARFSLGSLPIEDYPDLQGPEVSHHFAWPVRDAMRLVKELTFAISSEETRYYLNGVYFHVDAEAHAAEGLIGVATDGHRLARLRLPVPEGAAGMPGIILPKKFVAELGRLTEGDGPPEFEVALSNTKIHVARGEHSLTSKLIDATFPDYKRVIPESHVHRLDVDGKALAAALDRVTTVAGDKGRAVSLAIEATGIELKQRGADGQEGTEAVDAAFDADPLTIGFNGRYLAEILALLDCEHVEMRAASPGDPMLIRRRDDGLLTIVLMPMRV